MKDIKIAKDKVTCDFEEAENFENIKSGESIGTIFGKVQRWFNNLKGTPKRYYGSNGELRGVDLTPDSYNPPVPLNIASGRNSITSGA